MSVALTCFIQVDDAEELVSSSSQDHRFVNVSVQTQTSAKSGRQKGSGSNLQMMDENDLKKIIDKVYH